MPNSLVMREMQGGEERTLVARAQAGDAAALERLIRIHQPWVFGTIFRMVSDYHVAEDVSQEVLLKLVYKLSTFQGKSRLRTWLYRVAVNQVLSMKKARCREPWEERRSERAEGHNAEDRLINGIPDGKVVSAEIAVIAREAVVKSLMGMFLCLNRQQRIVHILGATLNVNSRTGSRILSISEANFRQILSRSKKRLRNFMNERCGLLNAGEPCRCERSLSAAGASGLLDPLRSIFHVEGVGEIRKIISRARESLLNIQNNHCRALYRDHPFQDSPDFSARVVEILNGEDCRSLLDVAFRR